MTDTTLKTNQLHIDYAEMVTSGYMDQFAMAGHGYGSSGYSDVKL